MVDGTLTGIDDTPPLTRLEVRANIPNPFSGTTAIRIGLPAPDEVTLEVFVVAGRRVVARSLHGSQGWQDIAFDGRDHAGRLLPSGVYFYRVHAVGEVITRKMVLRR
jgi:hypothetical protein